MDKQKTPLQEWWQHQLDIIWMGLIPVIILGIICGLMGMR